MSRHVAVNGKVSTLVDVLRCLAAAAPERRMYSFLDGDGEIVAELTRGDLDRWARAIAAQLQEAGLAGDRVLLLYPPGLDFIAAFLGCLYAGCVAVPTYPTGLRRADSALRAIVADAGPGAVLTVAKIRAQMPEGSPPAALREARWIATDELDLAMAAAWTEPEIGGEDLAFLQYTSGSTSSPKGVMVSHRNLLHNQQVIRDAFAQTAESIVVSWLPLYHDMGLIGGVLHPLYLGACCVLMSPMTFLQNPFRWLEAISRFRATTSGGPNFAYDLCVEKIADEQKAVLDLASWTVAFNGAEPVRPATLERFAETFARCRFAKRSFYPCYGLAEATLFVSGQPAAEAAYVRELSEPELRQGRVVPGSGTWVASCGRPWLDQRIRIVDPETRCPLGHGKIGEIWLAGRSVAQGYWRRPAENAATFGARLADSGEGPFLRTGDLGFLDGERGEHLFITGRLKDLIIIRGLNHYPQDIEATVAASHPDLRPGCGAAFAVEIADEERLVVVQELRRRHQQDTGAIVEAIRRALSETHQLKAHAIVLIRAGSVHKTTSGKIRRQACRNAYLAGELAVVAEGRSDGERPAAGDATPARDAAPALLRSAFRLLPPEQGAALIATHLASEIAGQLGIAPAAIADRPLSALGLDSLGAVELRGRIAQTLGVAPELASLLAGPTLHGLARELVAKLGEADEARRADEVHALVRGAETAEFPLTAGQRALWFVQQLDPESSAYNIAAAVRVRSVIDREALRRAAEALARRHPLLRTRVAQEPAAGLRQVIDPALGIDLRCKDAAATDAGELAARLAAEAARPFDLEHGPLVRIRLFTRAADDHVMTWNLHHIVADIWSLAILARDFGELYRAESTSQAAQLPALPIGFADWVRHSAAQIEGERGERLWEYWRAALGAPLPVLDLSTDLPRPPLQTYRGAACTRHFDHAFRAQLHALGQAHGTTLFMTLLGAFAALLHRYTGQRDLVVGSPMAGRTAPEVSDVVGYFVQPVALRADVSGRPSFAELLERVRRTVLGAIDHQDFPLPLLVERLRIRRDPSRSPIFQVMFVLQKGHPGSGEELAAFALGEEGGRIELGGLTLESMRLRRRASQFDLELMAAETPTGLAVSLIYNSDLFDRSTAERILRHFGVLLRGAAAAPAAPVARLPLLTAAEKHQLRVDWQDTEAPPDRRGFQERFQEQVAHRGAVIAAVCHGVAVSYSELNRRANRLAHALRRRGIGRGERVVVLMDRGIDLLTAILGIFKAGAVYLPLDPRHPPARLAETVAQSRPAALLAATAFAGILERARPATVAAPLFVLARLLAGESETADPPAGAGPEDVAYVIFTSGSTGRPKKVQVEHRGMVNHLRAKAADLAVTSADRVVQNASQCFDISIWQFLLAPFLGGAVCVFPDEVALDPARLLDATAQSEASVLEVVPSMLRAMLDEVEARGAARPACRRLRWLVPTGEALPPELCRRWLAAYPHVPLVNAYGPTECSDDVTHALITGPPPASWLQTPIGRPVLGMRMRVFDRALEDVPIGVPGELHVAGIGVGRGYLDDPRSTARAFIPELAATAPGARAYKTGDLVRYRADGLLEFLGRFDHQVKIRGHRLELGEIEARLFAHPAIREAVVLAREDEPGRKRLVAYVVPFAGHEPAAEEIRGYLGGQLAEYMVPSAIVFLAAMPLTANGKIDRRALPAPTWTRSELSSEFVAPRHPTEERLAAIWSELLGVAAVGARDNFFELGGHSLLASQIHLRAREAFRVELPLSALLRAPTVEEQAVAIEQARRRQATGAPDLERLPRSGELPLSFAQERFWFLYQLEPASAAYNVPAAVRLAGALAVATLRRTLDEVVRRHESLRTTFPSADGVPRQAIAAAAPVAFRHVDLSGIPAAQREAAAWREARSEAGRRFDLERGPLFQAVLLELEPTDHVLVLNMHHIISDGWSLRILLDEVTALYRALATGREPLLPALPWQFADLAHWQRRHYTGELLTRELAFWRHLLAGRTAVLDLPTDRPRPAAQGLRGRSEALAVPVGLVREIERLGAEHSATLYMTLLAVYQILLWRYTGQEANVGFPIAGRERLEAEGVIGLFVNTLVVPSDLGGEPPFAEVLTALRDRLLAIYDHQGLPFEKLVEELEPARDLAHSPLFQVLFAFQEDPAGGVELPELRLTPLALDSGAVKFPLTLVLERVAEGLEGMLRYDAELFDRTTIRRLAGHFTRLLEGIAAAPQRRIAELDYLTPAEGHELTIEWQDGAGVASPRLLVPDLFERQARALGDAPAVRFEDEVLSYRELNGRANRLARFLQELGVGPAVPVAILLDRSLEMVVAILGVLKAGGAYLPLEPATPRPRLVHVLGRARAKVVLTREALAGGLPGGVQAVALDREPLSRHAPGDGEENPRRHHDGRHPCYLIFTSGSTGTPKGVVIEHRQLASYVAGAVARLGAAGQSFATVSSVAADLGNTAIYAALTTGGTLHVIAEERLADPAALGEYFSHHPVDGLKIVPSHLAALLSSERPAAVLPRRTLVVGGEALSWKLADEIRRLAPGLRIFNHYGPTETTIGVAAYPLAGDRLRASTRTVPIGRPLTGNRLLVLDAGGRPVALGVAGEAHLGGGNLTRGYLGLPAVTAAGFVPDAFSSHPGGRLYKSGDRVRRRFDGSVEFLGRRDFQVKIRGFRVELGEVEAVLARHPEVREVVVLARPAPAAAAAAELRLVAYVVPASAQRLGDGSWPEALLSFVRERLPGHAVPAAVAVLESLPLTPNGKIDRRALPAPAAGPAPGPRATAPRDETEELLVRVWTEFLGREVDVHDDFFTLGGHSLLATRVVSRIRSAFGVELPVRSLFAAPTPARLAAVIAQARRGARPPAPPITPQAARREAALSFAQERLWFLQQFLEDNPAYSIPLTLTFRGRLERPALGAAFDALAERHEVLRTRYVAREATVVQVIEPPLPAPLPLADLSGLPAPARAPAARRVIAAEARRPFDLAAGVPLCKFLLRLDEQEHVLFLNYHHILSDGWSRGILHRELSVFYSAAAQGRRGRLPALPVQYADFAVWQRQWMAGEALAAELDYWRGRLGHQEGVLDLPTDRPRQGPGLFGRRADIELDRELSERVEAASRRSGFTPFMLFLAAWNTLLMRYSGQRRIHVGTPIAGRNYSEIEGLIGCFVNTLVIRTDLGPRMTGHQLLAQVRESTLDAYAHQDVPFEKLVTELDPQRSVHSTPLFQVVFALQNIPFEELAIPGVATTWESVGNGTVKFDLTLVLGRLDGRYQGVLEYGSEIYDKTTINRWLSHFRGLLEGLIDHPDERLGKLPLATAAERQQVLFEWNDTAAELPRERTIPELFDAQAAATPNAAALVYRGQRMSYRRLRRRSNQLARHLRSRGIGPESRVGLCAERSFDLVVAILAILKAGAAYVPLDPEYPDERLDFMLADSGVAAILLEQLFLTRFTRPGIPLVFLDAEMSTAARHSDADLPRLADSETLAYVMYTSGSSGRPKGVAVSHRGVVRLVRQSGFARFGPEEVFLQFAPISFDAATLELWGPLLNGGRLVLPAGALADLDELAQLIGQHGVTTLWLTAGLFHKMAELHPEALAEVRQLLAGGDVLAVRWVEQTLARLSGKPGFRLINGYGPTENTTFSCCQRLDATTAVGASVPIGRPIGHSVAYVLGPDLEPATLGMPGELCVGGEGLARGYFGRPALTAERFVPDPVSGTPGGRLYRTGDRVRFLGDGRIEFLGRIDFQVKIRGFRIEPGEIEAVLDADERVSESLVVAGDDPAGGRRLVAYVVAAGAPAPMEKDLRAALRRRLPEYMVPAAVVVLDAWPLTANGKIDRGRLPQPGVERVDAGGYVAPRDRLEEELAAMWSQLLGVERVGVEDSFFELGGHSLAATQMVSWMRQKYGFAPPLRLLYEEPTVAALSRAMAQAGSEPPTVADAEPVLRRRRRKTRKSGPEEVG